MSKNQKQTGFIEFFMVVEFILQLNKPGLSIAQVDKIASIR
ncbi:MULTISPECIES: hypothetical protein [unclassified Microcoleus]